MIGFRHFGKTNTFWSAPFDPQVIVPEADAIIAAVPLPLVAGDVEPLPLIEYESTAFLVLEAEVTDCEIGEE